MKNQLQQNTASNPKILHRDNYIIAVYKSKGVAFHERESSFVRLVEATIGCKVYPTHRLDQDVDGVVVFGTNSYSANLISKQFFERKVEKFYIGIVRGELNKNIIIKRPLTRRGRQYLAETFVWPIQAQSGLTLVRIVITTGRYHQIKRHLRVAGYPLLRDSAGAALSAVMISLLHPRTKRRVFFSCLQDAFALRLWRNLSGSKFTLSRKKLLSLS